MRILLVAYEFPPSPSPQSLRWAYLARELDRLGHEVHVLTADLGGETPGLPQLPDSIRTHRTFPGLLRGALAFYRKGWMRRSSTTQRNLSNKPAAHGNSTRNFIAPLRDPRNWKQRISEFVQTVAACVYFPDIRGEWRHWGRKELSRLLHEIDPDLLISSHEPATTLELVLENKRLDKPWVADFGDPVLAPYTPNRWKRRSQDIEQETCNRASAIVVTSDATRDLLRSRHGRVDEVHVITQGFDLSPELPGLAAPFESDRLELLYTGSLYAFRKIDQLLAALESAPSVRLNIASVTVPEEILQFAQRSPSQVRLLGFMPHRAALALQRQADILVNIANDDPAQVPGKFYEYLGACRPILHLGPRGQPIPDLVEDLKRGWSCDNDPAALRDLLVELANTHAHGQLESGLELGIGQVESFSWQAQARRLDSHLRSLLS